MVDEEVKRFLDEAHGRAHDVLTEHNDLLERIAQALLDRETIARTEIQALDRGDPLPPLPEPEEAPESVGAQPVTKPADEATPRSFGLGGEGPLPEPAAHITNLFLQLVYRRTVKQSIKVGLGRVGTNRLINTTIIYQPDTR